MNEEDWRYFVRFMKGGESNNLRPVKRLRVRKDMFTFTKGTQCWIAEDGHMYTLERPYHGNPKIIQMYVASTIERFHYRFDEFFEELPMLDGDLSERQRLQA